MLRNIRECLRMCEKSSNFAPFLHNLKICIKNMKNLTFLRVVLLTLCLTLLSTSIAWGTSYCGETISSNDGTCNAILTCNSPSANTYVLTVTSDDPNFEGISGDNWYCYINGGTNYHMVDNYTWDATNKVLTFTITSSQVPRMHTCMYLRFNGSEKLFCTIQHQTFDWPSSATCSYEPTPTTSRTYDGEEKMYFLRDAWSWWNNDGAKFYAYFWNTSTGAYAWSGEATNITTTLADSKVVYGYTVPEGTWDKVIITRHPSGTTTPTMDNKWNKSNDIALEATTNLIKDWTVDGQSGHSITWSNITLASKTVYFDNRNVTDWTTAYVRIGHNSSNSAWGTMTKVAGTRNLYSQTTSQWDYHTDFTIANAAGWIGSNNVYQPWENQWTGTGNTYQMSKQTNYQKYGIDRDSYLCPASTSTSERNCQYYKVNNSTSNTTIDSNNQRMALPQYTVTSAGTNCTVTLVQYTADDFSTNTALSSGGSVDPTRYVGVTVTPNAGYEFSSVSLTADAYVQHTAAAAGVTGKYAIMADCDITAVCTASTYTITYKDKGDVAFSGSHESGYPTTHTYGTSTTLKTATKSNFTFAGWYNNASCTGDPITTLGATAYTDNITLYAKWNAAPSVNAGPFGYDDCQISAIYTSGDEYSPAGIIEANWGVAALTTYYTDGSGKKAYRVDTKSGYYYGLYAGSTWEGVPTTLTDITDYTKLHIEFWSAEAQTFNLNGMTYYSSANHDGAVQSVSTTAGTWTVRDFNISDLGAAVTDHKDVFSGFKIDYGSGNTDKDLFIANIYFYNDDAPCDVNANREDLEDCQVLSVIGTTTYTPIGIDLCEPWGGPTRTRGTIGSKGTNNVEHISGGTAAALHFATPSNVQTFSKIHLEVWTADAMTLRFGLLCWKNNAYNDMGGGVDYHPQSFTTNAAKWTTIEFTLTDLTTMEWLVNASHLYFYDLAGEDLYITNVYFYNEEKDCTECSREGGAGSGQSFAGATLFATGYSYSIKWKAGSTGNPDSLIVSAEILDDITTGRILLFFHKTESGDEMYEEVEVAPAVDRTKVVTNKCIAIPPKVRDDDYAYLSVKFEKDGGGVYFTDRMFYDLKHGGCAEPSEAYFDIYHWDDAPVGARTSYNGGTIVTKIRYFRHFDTNWTTISVPFEVERVAVYDETDHVEYPLFPRFHNNSADVEGYYWLKTFPNWNTVPVPIRDFQTTWQQLTVATDYDGWDGGNISDFEETWLAANVKPEKNTPYAIKFPYSGYYETNWVIFYGAAFQTIASDFTGGTSITLTNDNYDYDQVKLQCNNTMHPSSALNNIYMIEEGADLFTRRESQAVPAFESYVIGTHAVQARYSVLRWSGSTPSTTDLDNRPTTADGAGKVYTVSGICVASFADSEQMETVLNTLNAGVYVVRVGSQINKVFVR